MKRREPQVPPIFAEILTACKAQHPSIEWEIVPCDMPGGAVYKLVGQRGAARTFERIEANGENAESAARVVAARIARIEKNAA